MGSQGCSPILKWPCILAQGTSTTVGPQGSLSFPPAGLGFLASYPSSHTWRGLWKVATFVPNREAAHLFPQSSRGWLLLGYCEPRAHLSTAQVAVELSLIGPKLESVFVLAGTLSTESGKERERADAVGARAVQDSPSMFLCPVHHFPHVPSCWGPFTITPVCLDQSTHPRAQDTAKR